MRYVVHLDLDEAGWWVATVDGVAGCHTQGRSIRQALLRVRDAIALCSDDKTEIVITPVIALPERAREAVARYESARDRLQREQTAARQGAADAVDILEREVGLSVRDVAELLGISHQRVHQIAHQAPRESSSRASG